MIDLSALSQFLYHANMPHATGAANTHSETDGSRTITFSEGNFSMHDNFFGGEPYGGRMVISYQHAPVWMMVYYGQFTATDFVPNAVYGFLREALQHGPEEKPFRGPDSYRKDTFEYRNEVTGDISSYSGKEVILQNGTQIYWATYLSGLVDQRAQESM